MAKKNVTMTEPHFMGHFPGNPVMPGVLIIEALAQTGAVAILCQDEWKGKTAYFAGINNAKFKQKTAYEMRESDWSSDVCSSDLSLCCGIPYGFSSQSLRCVAIQTMLPE